MPPFFEGLFLQASLILALGAQNLFVLDSGLEKRRHLLVAFVCSVCDALLILLGVAGASTVFQRWPVVRLIFGILGVGFLLLYGIRKIREGLRPQEGDRPDRREIAVSAKEVIALAVGFSLLNPHVYLDTVILIGGYSSRFPELLDKIQFGIGAGTFSVIWFYGLALFAAALGAFLKSGKAMARVALASGIILIALSVKLAVDVSAWL